MSGLALEEYELLEDPKYRGYVAAVDKALRNFENTSEWADLISTLGKLNKVLLSHMKYPVVPRRIIISKRLAQCLHPALPSGVHLKSLEIYDIIFKCMGTNRLSQELFIYSAGLFPLFGTAAMNVRSALLMIYETHFVPLGTRLRPGLNGFLSGILSGLEEGSDHLERTSFLLQRVAEGVGKLEFFGCLWECILNNSSIRLPAIVHVTSCFNKKLCTEDQLQILGTSIDVMVQGLCRALEDQTVLVQRAALDLTLLLLPMHNTQLLRNDLTAIVASSLLVLLRRDMSLNRRLFAWLLGSEVNLSILPSEHHVLKRLGSYDGGGIPSQDKTDSTSYFEAFSKDLLIEAFIILLGTAASGTSGYDVRPCKIIIPLLDKPDIGPDILDQIFLNFLRYLYRICNHLHPPASCIKTTILDKPIKESSSKATAEKSVHDVNKTALLVFSALRPKYPWQRVLVLLNEAFKSPGKESDAKIVEEVGSDAMKVAEIFKLMRFLLAFLPLDTEQQLQSAGIPELLSSILTLLTEHIRVLSATELATGLELCKAILGKLIPSVTQTVSSRSGSMSSCTSNLNVSTFQAQFASKLREFSFSAPSLEAGIIQIGIEASEKRKGNKISKFNNKKEAARSSSIPSLHDSVALSEDFNEERQKSSIHREFVDDEMLSPSIMQPDTPEHLSDNFEIDLSLDSLDKATEIEDTFESAVETLDLIGPSFLYKYVKEFQRFFQSYVERRIVSATFSFSDFETLLFRQVKENNGSNLKDLLQECLNSYHDGRNTIQLMSKCELGGSKSFDEKKSEELRSFTTLNASGADELDVFKMACGILVDLSSMPASSETKSFINPSSKQEFPQWLLSLLVCVACGHQMSRLFSQTAMSTLLELVGLAQSDLSVWKHRSAYHLKEVLEEGITTLQVLPLLLPYQTHCLLYHTYIFQYMTLELWNHLNIDMTSLHVSATELLLQLHSVALLKTSCTTSTLYLQYVSVVEKELLKTLTIGGYEYDNHPSKVTWSATSPRSGSNHSAILRWMTLWQVSRSISKGFLPLSGFNRCLFLMVERLRSVSAREKSHAHNWLGESLSCGDLARILDPILLFLLHPNTRRISVQHVNIKKLRSADKTDQDLSDDAEDSNIYAISSIKGEVLYHVGKSPENRFKPSSPILASLKRQISSIASDYDKKYVTQQANLRDYEVPSVNEDITGTPISIMINPFSRHPWIDINDLAQINKPGATLNSIRQMSHSNVARKDNADVPKWSSKDIATSILDEILDRVVMPKFESDFNEMSPLKQGASFDSFSKGKKKETTLHPLHSHMLLYMQIVDSNQCLYGLTLIKNILEAEPRQFLLSLASTSVTPQQRASPLLVLLGRHRRSVFGEGFDGGSVPDMVGQLRSAMYLQVVITICLYFIRSYYSRQPHLHIQEEHLHDNRELQVVAADVLDALFLHLIPLASASPRGFSPYVKDLLNKCKVQKCVLHCLLSTIHVLKERSEQKGVNQNTKTFSEDILEYNFDSWPNSSCEHPYLSSLMNLCLSLIKLEDVLLQSRIDPLPKDSDSQGSANTQVLTSLRYILGRPIPCQPMFLWAMLLALNQKDLKYFHTSWLRLFTSSLSHMGSSLPLNCLRIMNVLCGILEELSTYYGSTDSLPSVAPSDYTLHILTGLTTIVHFCLLESLATNSIVAAAAAAAAASQSSSGNNQTAGQIFYNLLHVFSPAGEVLEASLDTSAVDPLTCARKTILSHLPRLVSSLLGLWMNTQDAEKNPFILGSKQAVRQQIVELLSPVCHHHTPHLLAALSVVWQGTAEADFLHSTSSRREPITSSIWTCSEQQSALVEILSTLRVLPLHSLVENVKQVFRHPPVVEGTVQKIPLEVSVLQLFYLYVKETSATSQLAVCWASLLSLVKEGLLCLPPPALLVLLASLNEFVQRVPLMQDKKEVRELQEVAGKLLDAVSAIAGSRLEATTWLRRNLTVKAETDDREAQDVSSNSAFSVAALSVLADILAPMLDVLYSSEEKEKVVPLLLNVMANVIPYLRNHSSSNMAAFHACSQLLSSLSGYQYTLKAWRKDILELLLDANTFRMLPETMPYWKGLVDNLCTHDRTVFKELLSKISISQSGSLNLFTSKESEYETCAGLLKRLSFAIFCSETDQYLKLIPDIQERLTEVTRLGQVVPGLVAQVLLCFRVILLRISPRGTTSLWPIIITELVQVLLMMEQELSTDSEQFSSHLKRLSTLDYRWVVGAHNGLAAHNHPAWLSLYLAACKLLDLMLALPASLLPQFQMYRWAFVGVAPGSPQGPPELERKGAEWAAGNYLLRRCDFVPHLMRIARLMSQKNPKFTLPSAVGLAQPPGQLLLTAASIDTLLDLQTFFHILTVGASNSYTPPPAADPLSFKQEGGGGDVPKSHLSHIEAVIEKDFLEPLLL